MDHKASGSVVLAPAADVADPKPQKQEPAQQVLHNTLARVVLACSRAAALALVTYNVAVTAWRARREPGTLAFVAGAYVSLAALLLCLRRAEMLTLDSPAAESRRLQVAVCALSTALSCAFAYRVSLLMPAALAVVVWCMTSFVALGGFYMLLLCNKDEVGCDGVLATASPSSRPLGLRTNSCSE